MKLSIIIVNYNTEKFLYSCLESLYQDKTPLQNEWEILVVDNASDTLPDLKSYPKTTLITNKKNFGFSKANNTALKKAKGTYSLILNPDTIVSQETLNHLISVMEQDENIGIITPYIKLIDGTIDDACHRGFPTPWRAFTHFSGLGRLFPNTMVFNGYHLGYKNMDRVHEIEACVGACMLVRSSVGRSVGWFDEDYFWYGEDLDLCYKIHQKSHKILFDPRVYITHYKGVASGIKKHSKETATASKQTRRRSQKARVEAMRIFYDKHYKDHNSPLTNWLVKQGTHTLEWYFMSKL